MQTVVPLWYTVAIRMAASPDAQQADTGGHKYDKWPNKTCHSHAYWRHASFIQGSVLLLTTSHANLVSWNSPRTSLLSLSTGHFGYMGVTHKPLSKLRLAETTKCGGCKTLDGLCSALSIYSHIQCTMAFPNKGSQASDVAEQAEAPWYHY